MMHLLFFIVLNEFCLIAFYILSVKFEVVSHLEAAKLAARRRGINITKQINKA